MERVHFQQEQMVAELKDLRDKGLFNEREIKIIIERRTQFETALVRRVAKKADFLRYLQYEMGLERLRRLRADRLGLKGPHTVSDHSIVKRQYAIYERAVKKFKDDVPLWVEYIKCARREGASGLVGRICARGLAMHPLSAPLYILAAAHELENNHSPEAARALLQRGVRMNGESVSLWCEYVKMELSYIESMRRRWQVLGIADNNASKGDERSNPPDIAEGEEGFVPLDADDMDVDEAATQNDVAAARREIMSGGIVKQVIDSAVTACPKRELYDFLMDTIIMYPTATEVRDGVLDSLYDAVWRAGGGKAAEQPSTSSSRQTEIEQEERVGFVAARYVHVGMQGLNLVNGLQKACERCKPMEGFKSWATKTWLENGYLDGQDDLKEYVELMVNSPKGKRP